MLTAARGSTKPTSFEAMFSRQARLPVDNSKTRHSPEQLSLESKDDSKPFFTNQQAKRQEIESQT